MLTLLDKDLLGKITDMPDLPPDTAYSFRENGVGTDLHSTENITVEAKTDKPGINVTIKPFTFGESVRVPVVITDTGIQETVYNTFIVGEYADVDIIAGCGIHNCGDSGCEHNGVHDFVVNKYAKMRYIERHYGEGTGTGKRVFNPKTIIEVMEHGTAELEMTQIEGVDDTLRDTYVVLHDNAKLIVTERLLTTGVQNAVSDINVVLKGKGSSAQVISRSVAKDDSVQTFHMTLEGREECRGHIQCDSIIMHNAKVTSIPQISALSSDAELIHEAAIGRIANDQLTKLMTLGIDEEEAEDVILKGFLK